MTNIIEQCEYIAARAAETTLDQVAKLFGLEQYEENTPQRYRIFKWRGFPIKCSYCDHDDLWTERGGVWYCDHWGTEFLDLMPLKPVDDRLEMAEVARWEEV